MLLKIKFSFFPNHPFFSSIFVFIVYDGKKRTIANIYAVIHVTRTLINHISPFVIPFEPYHILSNSWWLSIKR